MRLTDSPHAGVDLDALVRPELVRFPAHDGVELTGWLYRPAGATGPGPTVLSFHGGPEGQERPSFNATYQALVARGIAVLAPNVRGSSGFGKKFVNLDNGELRFNGIKDIKSCVDYLVTSGIADPKRIGIMGGSYGGYATLAGVGADGNISARMSDGTILITPAGAMMDSGAQALGCTVFPAGVGNTELHMLSPELGAPIFQVRKQAEQTVVMADAELARSRRQAEQTIVMADADAEIVTGGVRGAVRDANGVVPGVTVTLTNEATNISREVVTNEVGLGVVPEHRSGRLFRDLLGLVPHGGPAICNVSVTNTCNATCNFCNFAHDKGLVTHRAWLDGDRFVEALTVLKQRANVRFVTFMGGEPLEAAALATRVAAEGGRCVFAGKRPVSELPQFLALADVLVSPRRTGGNTPFKVYTYLASGKPLVATRIPTHTQLLDDTLATLTEPTAESNQ